MVDALRALQAALVCAIPSLNGHICAGQAPSGEIEEIPNATLNLGRLSFAGQQALEQGSLGSGVEVFNVGSFEGVFSISLVCASTAARGQLEARILDLFLAQPLRAGILLCYVSAYPGLRRFPIAFELDATSWQDERAFDRRYGSLITGNVVIPALTTRAGVYTIRQLRLGLAAASDALPSATSMDAPGVEVVTINDDGSIAAAA